MWGSWFGVTFAGVLAVLFLIAISMAASPLLAVLIAAGVGLVAVLLVVSRRLHQAGVAETASQNPRSGGAPASGEGSGSPTSPNLAPQQRRGSATPRSGPAR
jgi:hypothetical protein